MNLKSWRKQSDMSIADLVQRLGLARTERTLMRVENGESQPDADMVARILDVTGGAVTPADMHATRLNWLKANRPEKFAGIAATEAMNPEAAE